MTRLDIFESEGTIGGQFVPYDGGTVYPLPERSEEDVRDRIVDAFTLPTASALLPPVVRWISRGRRQMILERPPQAIEVSYYGTSLGTISKETKEQRYTLPLPWTVYGLAFDADYRPYEIFVFAAKHSLEDFGDQLFLLPLPNYDLQAKFCPPHYNNDEFVPQDITQAINLAYNLVWDSGFNLDIREVVDYCYHNNTPDPIFRALSEQGAHMGRRSAANLFKAWQMFDVGDIVHWDWPVISTPDGEMYTALHLLTHLNSLEGNWNGNYFTNHLRQKLIS